MDRVHLKKNEKAGKSARRRQVHLVPSSFFLSCLIEKLLFFKPESIFIKLV